MRAYYNENEPYAAQWLENLIAAGDLPAGDVDRRSIKDVGDGDLRGYGQCHFFAGIGGWPYALKLAGWPDGRPVWTGSCPCQPFSQIGERKGFIDDRDLWPAWLPLIAKCQPSTIFGEQVANAWLWLDRTFEDLEGLDYACGMASLPAAAVGAPHIRDRLWYVADAARRWREGGPGLRQAIKKQNWYKSADRAWWDAEPSVPRVADGLPCAVDQRRAFGNAIVPQLAAQFIACFAEINPVN